MGSEATIPPSLCRWIRGAWLALVALLAGAPAAAQAVKAVVAATSLQPTAEAQWRRELRYRETEVHPLTIAAMGCPFLEVEAGGVRAPMMLDTGTARGVLITSSALRIPYRSLGRSKQLHSDGTYRGESERVSIEKLNVLGREFRNVTGALADWQMFSSEPFNGTVGLDFFLDRRFTLDYRNRKVAVTDSELPDAVDPERYWVIELVDPPKSQGHVLYARGRVAGRDALIYLDTGYNVSFLSPGFGAGLSQVERPGKFKRFRNGAVLQMGAHTMTLNELRESAISRGEGFDLPVALILGSDVLSRFLVTVDLRTKRLILALGER